MDLDLHKMTQTLIFWIFLIKSTTKNGSPRHTVPHPTTAQKHSSQQGPSRRGECKVSKGQELNLPPPPLGLAASLPDLLPALPPPPQVALEDNQPGVSPKNSASLTLRWQRTLQVTGIQIAVCCSRVVRTRWMQMSWIICTQNKAPHLKKDIGRLKHVYSCAIWLVGGLSHELLGKLKEDAEGWSLSSNTCRVVI